MSRGIFVAAFWCAIFTVIVVSPANSALAQSGVQNTKVAATSRERLTLSESVRIEGIPAFVRPYAAGTTVTLKNLRLIREGSSVTGKAEYSLRDEKQQFSLVIYCSLPKRVLVSYKDAEKDLTLALPSGDTAFNLSGYRLSEGKAGTIEFSIITRMSGVYDITDLVGTVFVFTVPGTVNPRSSLPGDQKDSTTFDANSNVLENKSFQF